MIICIYSYFYKLQYWVDYKAKLKKKVAAVRQSQARTGGGPSDIPPLNEVERKFLSLLGENFGVGLPNVQVDPFPNVSIKFKLQ